MHSVYYKREMMIFKDYIENCPDSSISYVYSQLARFKEIEEKSYKKNNFMFFLFFALNAIVPVLPSGFKLPLFPICSSIAVFTWLAIELQTIKKKKKQVFHHTMLNFDSKQKIAEFLNELQQIQDSAHSAKLEVFIYKLKKSYLEDNYIDQQYLIDLFKFMNENYEQIEDKNSLKINHSIHEMEIGMTNAKRIL